jgi:hypothetical protein
VGLVGWLNLWGGAWAGFMVRALVDSSVLLAALLLAWLPLRRRMSAQLAYGLFLLVLLKLAMPVPATGLAWATRLSPAQDFAGMRPHPDQRPATVPSVPIAARAEDLDFGNGFDKGGEGRVSGISLSVADQAFQTDQRYALPLCLGYHCLKT